MFSRQKPPSETEPNALADAKQAIEARADGIRRATEGPGFAPNAPSAPSRAAPLRNAMPSIFAEDLKVTGSIMTDGAVELNGPVDGTVYAMQVQIGATAAFEGDVVAERVVINGPAKGRITARHVHLKPGARFVGDLIHQRLVIDEGAEFEGAVHRKVDEAAWAEISHTFEAPGVELTDAAARAVDALRAEFLKG